MTTSLTAPDSRFILKGTITGRFGREYLHRGSRRVLNCTIEEIHEAWGPHPGCKEFMTEPDTFPVKCDDEARYRVVWTNDFENFRDDGPYDIEIWAELMCPKHWGYFLQDFEDQLNFVVHYKVTDIITAAVSDIHLKR